VYVKPPKEAEATGYLWRLVKCLYGLKDASRQWYIKVSDKLISLGFKKSKYDQGFFYYQYGGQLHGCVGLHVDDFLHAGSQHFNKHIMPQILDIFKVGKSESGEFMYTGFMLKQNKRNITLDQTDYVSNLEIPLLDAKRLLQKEQWMTQFELTLLRRMAGGLNWVVRATRPDLSFSMINISTKFKGGKIQDLVDARNTLNNLKRNKAIITISNVSNIKNCEIWCYLDAAFRNLNEKQDSAGGYVILIVNLNSGKCAPIEWKANKIKRKVASTLAAETISLGTALDAAVAVKDMLFEITAGNIDLQVKAIIDNKSARDAVYSSTSITERRLRAEVALVKEMMDEKTVSEVKWVRGEHMLADILTKSGPSSLPLMSVMQDGQLSEEMMRICK
jgi:hypothetical protein